MSAKSEVATIFEMFYKMVENVFQTKINILQTDNGVDYFKNTLSSFLNEKGILHQTSCSYTPQQNGIAERKNRHLLEVARALLFTMNVPSFLWAEAVLTASFLINRMPTKVLNYVSPLHHLKTVFPTTHVGTNLPLRIFGCTVYAHISSPGRSKLAPRAQKCVFVGYAASQKGYKLYNPVTKKIFVSLDVTFLEQQPYFLKKPLQGSILERKSLFG